MSSNQATQEADELDASDSSTGVNAICNSNGLGTALDTHSMQDPGPYDGFTGEGGALGRGSRMMASAGSGRIDWQLGTLEGMFDNKGGLAAPRNFGALPAPSKGGVSSPIAAENAGQRAFFGTLGHLYSSARVELIRLGDAISLQSQNSTAGGGAESARSSLCESPPRSPRVAMKSMQWLSPMRLPVAVSPNGTTAPSSPSEPVIPQPGGGAQIVTTTTEGTLTAAQPRQPSRLQREGLVAQDLGLYPREGTAVDAAPSEVGAQAMLSVSGEGDSEDQPSQGVVLETASVSESGDSASVSDQELTAAAAAVAVARVSLLNGDPRYVEHEVLINLFIQSCGLPCGRAL